jgi:hypothetical protein
MVRNRPAEPKKTNPVKPNFKIARRRQRSEQKGCGELALHRYDVADLANSPLQGASRN